MISFAIEDGLDEDFMSAFNDDPDFVEDIGDLFLCPEVIKDVVSSMKLDLIVSLDIH